MATNVQDFLDQIDIVDVIGHYITLRKMGNNYAAPCPFHSETKPSFSVSRNKQFYHCFGCGASGNAIRFIQEYENLNFVEAIKLLCDRHGLNFEFQKQSRSNMPTKDEKQPYYDAFDFVISMCHQYLYSSNRDAKEAMQYLLEKRKLTPELINHFKIGYIPRDSSILKRRIIENYKEPDIFEKIGILGRKENRIYAKLFHRVTFPIYDPFNNCIALGARVLDDSSPKYINSPESPVFSKSKTFYGLNWAKTSVNKEKKIIICEGYLDVIRLHQHHYDYTVATLGTALTREHCRLLKRRAQMIYLLFDSDTPGIKAALKAVRLLVEFDIQYKIVFLADNQDPDSYFHDHTQKEFHEALNKGTDILNFIYQFYLRLNGAIRNEEKHHIMDAVLPIIHASSNALRQEEYLIHLSSMLGVGIHSLRYELQKQVTHQPFAMREEQENEKKPKKKVPQKPEEKVIKQLLAILLHDPELKNVYKQIVNISLLDESTAKEVLLLLLNYDNALHLDLLKSKIEELNMNHDQQSLLYKLLMQTEEFSTTDTETLTHRAFELLKQLFGFELKKLILITKTQMKNEYDPVVKNNLFHKLLDLMKYKDNPDSYLQFKLEEHIKNESNQDKSISKDDTLDPEASVESKSDGADIENPNTKKTSLDDSKFTDSPLDESTFEETAPPDDQSIESSLNESMFEETALDDSMFEETALDDSMLDDVILPHQTESNENNPPF